MRRRHWGYGAAAAAVVVASGTYAKTGGGTTTIARPDPHLTPGAILTVDLPTLCTPGYTASIRNVPPTARAQVFATYHKTDTPNTWEVDHLVSLELGGSNDLTNLWPQPIAQARKKDQVENRLHQEVCNQTITLDEAQKEIRDPSRWGL